MKDFTPGVPDFYTRLMRIILASPRGFCAGVRMAIDTVQEAVDLLGTPLYVYHEIVHNRHVVERFQNTGVRFVDDLHDVPEGATVVFSAHGVSPQIRQVAKQRRLTAIDATCPLVTKVHAEAIRYARQGYHILLVGHRGHDEVVGTVGEAPDSVTVVESPQEVDRLTFGPDARLVYLTQTTLSVDDAQRIIGAIRRRYPNVKAPPSDDICYATTNRQTAVRELAGRADLVLVVGSRNSSNSVRLTEIAEADGTAARLLDDAGELNEAWFAGVDTVLVTAGASAPDHLIQEIVEELVRRYDGTVEHAEVVEEDVTFNLPVTLRVMKAQAAGAA